MYDPGRISERLDLAQAQLGWRPVYHSLAEVDRMKRELEAIAVFDDAGNFKETARPFTQKEVDWIRNERMLCACDASYYLTRYAYLKDDENHIIRFKFRNPQKVYFDVVAELERSGASIQLIVLKGRQLGVSTITELLVAHRIFFYYGVNAVIASSGQQQTQIMSQMIFLAYDNLPYWMKPNERTRSESARGEITFQNKSGVSFQHGSQTTGIARGHTPTVVHLSECASYPNADELVDASLFRAVHESPEVFMVLESTAEGIDNWWHKTWKHSKSAWADGGKSKLYPLFLPWYIGTEMYPKPTWLKTRPVPEDWQPNRETQLRMAKAKAFVASSPLLGKVLGEDWELSREQAWFSEVDFEEYKAKGKEKLWPQEMSGDDIEAFQGSFDSVFGNDLLKTLHESRTRNYSMYQITGEGIEDKFNPLREEVDTEKPIRILQYRNKRENVYKWHLVPIKSYVVQVPDDPTDSSMDDAVEQADGKLLIFHEPRLGMDYTIGVDSSKGVGRDSTVISVWAKGQGGAPDIQCAEFASAFVSHVEAYAFAMAIATLYSKFMGEGKNSEPLLSIEVVEAVGDMIQLQMSKMGYKRFHQFIRYDSTNPSKKDSKRRGWYTVGWSRPLLIDGFVHSVKNGWVEIHSPFLLAEMRKFEIHFTGRGKERLEHASGSHDDRVFSSAIAVFTAHDLDLMIERGKKRYVPSNQINKPAIDLGGYNPSKFMGDQKMSNQFKSTRDIEDLLAERLSY